MAQPHHTVEGGSRRHGFHFYIYNPSGRQIGSLRRLSSEQSWRLELKLPSERRILQLFPTFDEAHTYLARVHEIVYHQAVV